MARLQISLRGILILTAGVAALLAIAIELNRRIENLVLNPYRLQSTGDLLVAYLEDVGDWPEDWKALHQYVESHPSHPSGVKTFKELQDNITVDFSFNPDLVDYESLWSDDNPQLKVVFSNDGGINGATRDPNSTIFLYLQHSQHIKK